MKFKHEDLEVFKLSMELVESVTSIPLNIAEGSGKHSKDDFARFIRNSIGSLLETDTNLKIAMSLTYLELSDYAIADKHIEKLYFKLIALHKSLKS